MSETPKWYVIHTYSGYENKVASSIMKAVENRKMSDLITEVKIPVETVREIKKVIVKKKDKDGTVHEEEETRIHDVERKLFPGYVLVKMIRTDESWYLVRNTRGCTGFVSPDSNAPVPLTDEEAEKWGVGYDNTEPTVELGYQIGDTVSIRSGSFGGQVGVVEDIDIENNVVYLTILMFGQKTPVETSLDNVQLSEE